MGPITNKYSKLSRIVAVLAVVLSGILACSESASLAETTDLEGIVEATVALPEATHTPEQTPTASPTSTPTQGEKFRDQVLEIAEGYVYNFEVIVYLFDEVNYQGRQISDEDWQFALVVELQEIAKKNRELEKLTVPADHSVTESDLDAVVNNYDRYVRLLIEGVEEEDNSKITEAVEASKEGHRALEELVSEVVEWEKETKDGEEPEHTPISSEVVMDAFRIVGESVPEVESILGEPVEVISNDDDDDKLAGGEDRIYAWGNYEFLVSFDREGIARLFQVWRGLSEEGYQLEDYRELFSRFGASVERAPDLKNQLIWEWSDYQGYQIRVAASQGVVHSIQIAQVAYAP